MKEVAHHAATRGGNGLDRVLRGVDHHLEPEKF